MEILRRDEPERARDNVTVKALGSSQTWVVVPLDHPSFASRPGPAGERERSDPEAPEEWLAGLARVAGLGAATVPTIAACDDIPFAAGIGAGDPVRLDRVFDDRYFMATTELNLLNALLLAWTPPQESEC